MTARIESPVCMYFPIIHTAISQINSGSLLIFQRTGSKIKSDFHDNIMPCTLQYNPVNAGVPCSGDMPAQYRL